MYLLADEQVVELYNQTDYSEKYQREMTISEYIEGKRLYYKAKEFFKEFIGQPYTLETLEKLLSKVRHTNGFCLVDNTITANQIMNDPLSRYIDVYVEGNSTCILVILSEHDTEQDVTGIVHMYDCYDQDINGLDYTFEDIAPNKSYIIVTSDDIKQGNILDKMYKKIK